jgi:hypothetical protein
MYDSTKDTHDHIAAVQHFMNVAIMNLIGRMEINKAIEALEIVEQFYFETSENDFTDDDTCRLLEENADAIFAIEAALVAEINVIEQVLAKQYVETHTACQQNVNDDRATAAQNDEV